MSKLFSKLFLIALLFIGAQSFAQSDSVTVYKPVNLNGPRVGLTYIFPGELADRLDDKFNIDPFLVQFGWQFETRFFTLDNGTQGLIEYAFLAGGLEKNLFIPSGTFLVGLRNRDGFEFMFGPNISVSGASFAIAGGFTLNKGGVNFPINIAIVPSNSGVRLSILAGFNAAR